MPHKITVRTNGQTLTVNASVSHWTSEALALAASSSNDVESSTTTTITSDYDMWFANTATEATITVKQLDGTTLLSQAFPVTPGHGNRTLNPVPDVFKLAADVDAPRDWHLPTGALAQTMPRNGSLTSAAALTSGTMVMSAVHLDAGTTVTSITYASGTTAAGTPTAWWFALYDSSLGLLGQTADQTTTAWAANTVKTLNLASPVVTTYTGLHYVAIMVAASTVPTLVGVTSSNTSMGIAPRLHGASTTSLTTTAPATADALTNNATPVYAYVS